MAISEKAITSEASHFSRQQGDVPRPGTQIGFEWDRDSRSQRREVLEGTNMQAIRALGPTRLSQTEKILPSGQIISLSGLST